MIVCPRCGKENQDHYKFCLGCGAELPRDAQQQPKSFNPPTPPGGTPVEGLNTGAPAPAPVPNVAAPQFGGAAAASAPAPAPGGFGHAPAPAPPPPAPPPPGNGAAPAAPAASGETIHCPNCNAENSPSFKFCGACGHPLQGVAPAPAPSPAPAPVPATGGGRGTLVLIRPDGSEGESIAFDDGQVVGRTSMPQFGNDSYLSPKHASLHFQGAALAVRDEGSLNGIYVRIDRETPIELPDRAIFRIGQEILRFEALGPPAKGPDGVEPMGSPRQGLVGRICLLTGRETSGNCYSVPEAGLHLGRERGDILFPDDGYVSGLHARLHAEGGRVFLTDVGSSNGTFIRIVEQGEVGSGSMVLMGQQLFRVEY